MRSSEEKGRWVLRWRYLMAPTPRRGIWRLKAGGFFVRVRVTDVRTGKRYQCARALRGPNVTIWDAVRVRDQLRHEGHDLAGKIRSMPLWSEYAASLFEAKVTEGRAARACAPGSMMRLRLARCRWASSAARDPRPAPAIPTRWLTRAVTACSEAEIFV